MLDHFGGHGQMGRRGRYAYEREECESEHDEGYHVVHHESQGGYVNGHGNHGMMGNHHRLPHHSAHRQEYYSSEEEEEEEIIESHQSHMMLQQQFGHPPPPLHFMPPPPMPPPRNHKMNDGSYGRRKESYQEVKHQTMHMAPHHIPPHHQNTGHGRDHAGVRPLAMAAGGYPAGHVKPGYWGDKAL
ncbi:PREDICTED: histidine-rich glycoprotein [Tarenaya hassleriana]|uniref:histidine-rich glycoprotein n=1 Tax=Tarenaya hassleriana TaxID=28532 RepID=UPI00053C6F73|nr:PREDICTED: histidine-rich glycoprotein [Tarenaya hassleriana]